MSKVQMNFCLLWLLWFLLVALTLPNFMWKGLVKDWIGFKYFEWLRNKVSIVEERLLVGASGSQ